ncbi:MAG: asparagine synthase (glutamine-hydrolysing) [bacterium]|nr:MAG: asparagine synthase (glutamine-hydrolysing) [bacterium]
MCGILGWQSPGPIDRPLFEAALDQMSHRGPDDRGSWYTPTDGNRGELALGHRRLSILDLSPRGHQPMTSHDGRRTMTYNGEVFNFHDVRRDLQALGHRFTSDSDTEVMLEAWLAWGPDCLHRFNGMFAFGMWDESAKALHLVRDRVGVKPLYWTEGPWGLAFASEVKSLLAIPGVPRRLNERRLAHFLNFLWVPGPETLFEGIHKLEPGHRLVRQHGRTEISRWWDVPSTEDHAKSESAWIDELRGLMDDSVRLRLVSDVPVGAFLSGGVDSSAILAAMRRHTKGELIAYAVGFRGQDQRYEFAPDDMTYARMVAAQTPGLDFHEIIVEPDVAELLPKIVWHMDEPVADAAAISTYLICRASREKATVMLSGVGAEEVFGGYRRHHAVGLAEDYLRWPGLLRRGVKTLSDALPGSAPGPGLALRRNLQKFTASAELPYSHRYFGYCGYYTSAELRAVVAPNLPTEDVLIEHEHRLAEAGPRDPLNRLLYVDLKTFLPCLNLTYSDKASMAASTEVRVPVLDYRIVELAATMPPELKVKGSRQKWVFKQAVAPWVPEAVVKRPKTGFGGPTRSWVKNDLREMVDDLLSESTLKKRGLLNPAEVRRLIDEDRSGRRDHAYRIWTFMTLELWLRTFIDRTDSSAPLGGA